MKFFKAPTLRLKALNKHSITHIMYIEMEMLSGKEKRNVDINMGSSIVMQKKHTYKPLSLFVVVLTKKSG